MNERLHVEQLPSGVEIRIAAKKNWLLICLMAILFFALVFTWGWWILFLIGRALHPAHFLETIFVAAFLFISLLLFVGVLAQIIYGIAWCFLGKEIIAVSEGSLLITKELRGRGKTLRYDLRKIANLRTVESQVEDELKTADQKDNQAVIIRRMVDFLNQLAYWMPVGAFSFDYDGQKRRFGLQLDKEEAEQILTALRPQLSKTAFPAAR